jgi:glyoxylase-like metal-dependent hydrolase (beta-lactamase superfamily II)
MPRAVQVAPHVYQVGGNGLSHPNDCCVYLVEGDRESVLIDTGAGQSAALLIDNAQQIGIDIKTIKYIVATHGHIDHIGGLKALQEQLSAQVIAHQLELPAIEQGLPRLTAADWYRTVYQPVKVDIVIKFEQEILEIGGLKFFMLHTPGHTPGGISVYVEIDGLRILFGQDIHGPFNQEWGSDMTRWRNSMNKLLELKADILCEGHFGIYRPNQAVTNYINSYLNRW